ncbi:MMPL family transporter [Yinghuangia aomiensis]
MQVYTAGPAGIAADQAEAFSGIDGMLLVTTVLIVIVILLLTYRSPTLWFVPLSAIFAMVAAWAVVYLATKAGVTVNGQSYAVLNIMIFGAGTDYALLLIARYREELRNYEDRHEAMARTAPRRSGHHRQCRHRGPVDAGAARRRDELHAGPRPGVRHRHRRRPARHDHPAARPAGHLRPLGVLAEDPARGHRAGGARERHLDPGRRRHREARPHRGAHRGHPRRVALGLTGLKADGLEQADGFTKKPDSIKGMEIANKSFPRGAGDPIYIITNEAAAGTVPGRPCRRSEVSRPTALSWTARTSRATAWSNCPSPCRTARTPPPPGTPWSVCATPSTRSPDADAKVGGGPAMALDMQAASEHDDKVIIPLILLAVLIVLCLLLRAIVAPVILVLTVVLSFAAALGISSLIFNHVFRVRGHGHRHAAVHLRVPRRPGHRLQHLPDAPGPRGSRPPRHPAGRDRRPRGHRRGHHVGGPRARQRPSRVFVTMPMVNFVEMGFAVALGVLLDTFIVRSVLVTALTHDIGPKIWWPSPPGQAARAVRRRRGRRGPRPGPRTGGLATPR